MDARHLNIKEWPWRAMIKSWLDKRAINLVHSALWNNSIQSKTKSIICLSIAESTFTHNAEETQ